MTWLFKMAWRDSRRNYKRLLLFTSSIVLGIAALVSIDGFGENLKHDIDKEAGSLLGADLRISTSRTIKPATQSFLDSIAQFGDISKEVSFASMVSFVKTEDTRIVNVRALEGKYPYYGNILTEPASAYAELSQGQHTLLDEQVMKEFDIVLGDSVKVGNLVFVVTGKIKGIPGQTTVQMGVVPSIYIPMQYLDASGLIQFGSRYLRKFYYQYEDEKLADQLKEKYQKQYRPEGLDFDSIASSKRQTSQAFGVMTRFLNLVGFIALLLGCIGVASAVHIYIKGKLQTVAILRCLGIKGDKAFLIYLIQIAGMGLVGSLIGVVLGTFLQTVLPSVLSDFLPIAVSFGISWYSIGKGILLGILISVLFALIPLMNIRNVSPLRTLRVNEEVSEKGLGRWIVFGLIGAFILGFTYLQIGSLIEATFFVLFILFSFIILAAVAWLVMFLVRRIIPSNWSFILRQGFANLHRPNNQTFILVLSIGLGTALIATLFFMRGLLLDQISVAQAGDRPNMIVFDVQTPQKDQLLALTDSMDLPVLQQVPIVTMQLEKVKSMTRKEMMADSTRKDRWALNRENRVTYRDSIINSETIIDGAWVGNYDGNGPVPISLEKDYARAIGASLNDPLVFNVQGVELETVVSSIREIAWNRIQTNFLILFPNNILEQAPQFHVLITRTSSTDQSVAYQRNVVKAFPNVSVVGLEQILSTVDDLIGKISFVINFMALFSILTGLLILIGSVILSRFQRIKESVLLRTLGANRKQVLLINLTEYALLGLIAAFTGILLALVGSYALAVFVFQSPYSIKIVPIIIVLVTIVSLVVLIGLSNSRGILNRPPLEVLRGES